MHDAPVVIHVANEVIHVFSGELPARVRGPMSKKINGSTTARRALVLPFFF